MVVIVVVARSNVGHLIKVDGSQLIVVGCWGVDHLAIVIVGGCGGGIASWFTGHGLIGAPDLLKQVRSTPLEVLVCELILVDLSEAVEVELPDERLRLAREKNVILLAKAESLKRELVDDEAEPVWRPADGLLEPTVVDQAPELLGEN